jgi:hypothetical protein
MGHFKKLKQIRKDILLFAKEVKMNKPIGSEAKMTSDKCNDFIESLKKLFEEIVTKLEDKYKKYI